MAQGAACGEGWLDREYSGFIFSCVSITCIKLQGFNLSIVLTGTSG